MKLEQPIKEENHVPVYHWKCAPVNTPLEVVRTDFDLQDDIVQPGDVIIVMPDGVDSKLILTHRRTYLHLPTYDVFVKVRKDIKQLTLQF